MCILVFNLSSVPIGNGAYMAAAIPTLKNMCIKKFNNP